MQFLLVLTGSLLLVLAGCAGDSMKSSQPTAGDRSTSTVVQGEGDQGKPLAEEVQERGVVTPFRPSAPVIGAMPGTGPLPNPVVAFGGVSGVTCNSTPYLSYYLAVTNHAAYPDALFAPAPSLPPCPCPSVTTTPSRTEVYFYDQNGTAIGQYNFFRSSNALGNLVYYYPTNCGYGCGNLAAYYAPTQIRVVLRDRQAGRDYVSDLVSLTAAPTFSPTVPVCEEFTAFQRIMPLMQRGVEGEQLVEPPPGAPGTSEQPSGEKPK